MHCEISLWLICSFPSNFQTLYVWSSLFSALAYFLMGTYGCLWLKQPGFEWMPPFCISFLIFSSCLGMFPMPYVIAVEIFPKKVGIDVNNSFTSSWNSLCCCFADSTNWLSINLCIVLDHFVRSLLGIFYICRNIWSIQLYVRIRGSLSIECIIWNIFYDWNPWKIICWN